VGSFGEDLAMSLDRLQGLASGEAVALEGAALLPVEAGVAALPALRVSSGDAARLMRGQAVLLRGRDAPVLAGWVSVSSQSALIALAEVEKGELRPRRIFNLPRA
jgi:tRNA pseudouridine55 synthase